MSEKKVTLKEIAQKTGVSLATVHRVIYGKDGVGEETRKRILEEVQRSHYQVDEVASTLKRNARKVYVVLPKAQNEDRFYFADIWRGIREAAKQVEQYKITFQFIESEYSLVDLTRELERVYDEYLDDMDGLITLGDSEMADRWLTRFAKRGVFTVLISTHYTMEDEMIRNIVVNHECSGRLAAEYLHDTMKKDQNKVLVFAGNTNIYSNNVGAQNCISELEKLGHQVLQLTGFSRTEIEEKFLECMNTESIGGIFVNNARNTYSCCKILSEHGLGRDMVVVGTDAFAEIKPFFHSGILNAVICQYQWEQGSQAVHRMHEYFNRGNKGEHESCITPVLLMRNNIDYFC